MRRTVLVSLAGVGLLLTATALLVAWGLPSRAEVRALAKSTPETTALMRQRDGEAKTQKRSPRRAQTWVPLSRVSRNLIVAVVASEDQRFFAHHGVDWGAVRESFEHNVEAGRAARGGSTITQQLVKNLFFGTRKTLLRKLRELVVARWVEEDLTKPRILEIYLNVIEWGDGTWGCDAAARHWYGVEAASLTRREAAGLAAMIPNPRRINPRVSPQGHERLTRRVLWLMELGRAIAHDVAGLGADPPPEASWEPEGEGVPDVDEADLLGESRADEHSLATGHDGERMAEPDPPAPPAPPGSGNDVPEAEGLTAPPAPGEQTAPESEPPPAANDAPPPP